MKQFYTVVLDRFRDVSGTFETEPYEAGWADEAIFFVRVHELDSGATVNARVQISYDGITWVDEGTSFKPISTKGDHFVRVTHFGGWLRLALVASEQKPTKLTLSLVLKG